MKNKDRILKLLSSKNGIILRKDLVKLNIPTMYLSNLVKEGVIERVGVGVYFDRNTFGDDFFKIQTVSKNAIFSNNTALYFHGLSKRTPITYDMTVPHNYNGSLMNNKFINLFRVKKEILSLGVVYMISPQGKEVKLYDKERTICDIIKNKKKIDNEIINQAIKNYISSDDLDIYKLTEYAKKLKVDKKVNKYLEVLL